MVFKGRIELLAQNKGRSRIFTPFGEATGVFTFCDGEECEFCTTAGNTFRLFCIDILGLEEYPTVPSE